MNIIVKVAKGKQTMQTQNNTSFHWKIQEKYQTQLLREIYQILAYYLKAIPSNHQPDRETTKAKRVTIYLTTL